MAKKVKEAGFEFDVDLPIPAATRTGRQSETAQRLAAMPVGASFLEAVTVPDTIKKEDERAASFREQARAVANRLSGAIRRFRDKDPVKRFELRTVSDDTLGYGVRVYRVADQAVDPAAKPEAKAA
jgi:hypothetical protein